MTRSLTREQLQAELDRAKADAKLWRDAEREWRTPKHDLTAFFVRKRASEELRKAEKRIAKLEKQLTS